MFSLAIREALFTVLTKSLFLLASPTVPYVTTDSPFLKKTGRNSRSLRLQGTTGTDTVPVEEVPSTKTKSEVGAGTGPSLVEREAFR